MSARVIKTKNPLHASALRINDLNPGIPVIWFDIYDGIIMEGLIRDSPYVEPEEYRITVVIQDEDGEIDAYELGELGVIEAYGFFDEEPAWNDHRFLIDARKRHLLPDPLPLPQALLMIDGFWGSYSDIEYAEGYFAFGDFSEDEEIEEEG